MSSLTLPSCRTCQPRHLLVTGKDSGKSGKSGNRPNTTTRGIATTHIPENSRRAAIYSCDPQRRGNSGNDSGNISGKNGNGPRMFCRRSIHAYVSGKNPDNIPAIISATSPARMVSPVSLKSMPNLEKFSTRRLQHTQRRRYSGNIGKKNGNNSGNISRYNSRCPSLL